MAFPVLYLLLAAVFFNIPAGQCLRILLSPTYYLLGFLAALGGYGLWEMRRWGWYVFATTNLFVLYSNAVLVSQYGQSNHKLLAFSVSVVVVVGLVMRVGREIRVPYFLPNIRWWESNPRYRLSVPVAIEPQDPPHLEGEIVDLSMGGCFVKLREQLTLDETITLEFTAFGHTVRCTGVVVWCTDSTVTHPKGVGVKFNPLPRMQRRILRAITHRLKEISALYRSSRYILPEDEFDRRMSRLQGERVRLSRFDSGRKTS